MNLDNYSNEIKKAFAKIKIGDRIKITKGKETFEGLLMPRISMGNKNSIIIKLDDGYNIGINFDKNLKIEKLSSEKTTELGKRKFTEKIKFNKSKPKVSLVATGGTIASRVDYKTGGVCMLMEPDEIVQAVPELADIINLDNVSVPFTKATEDMRLLDIKKIASFCENELNKKEVKGLIVTHGTDILHYSSALLSFMLRDLNKPVVLVGSQRSSDRGSTDAAFNLICSSHTAISDMAEVGICMHGETSDNYCLFNRGTKVRKMHTSRRDAFRPINEKPLAKIYPDGRIEKMNNTIRKRSSGKVKLDDKIEENVALIKVFPGSDPSVLDFYVKNGCKGFVLEATALGHVPTNSEKSWIPKIKETIKSGIPVCVSTQSIYGRVHPHVYSNLRTLFHEAEALPLEDMLSETAYVKLSWVLGHTNNMKKVKEMMLKNYAGEISLRSDPESFLF